jgi:hypothetical protein
LASRPVSESFHSDAKKPNHDIRSADDGHRQVVLEFERLAILGENGGTHGGTPASMR